MSCKQFRPAWALAAGVVVTMVVCPFAMGQDYDAASIEEEIRSALEQNYGTENGEYGWEFEEWGDEWEYEFPGGQIEIEPDDDDNAENIDPAAAVREALASQGNWEPDAWEDGWEYHYAGGELEYDPNYGDYGASDYDYDYDPYVYDPYDYGYGGDWEYGFHVDYDRFSDDDLEYGWYYTDDWYDGAAFDNWYD